MSYDECGQALLKRKLTNSESFFQYTFSSFSSLSIAIKWNCRNTTSRRLLRVLGRLLITVSTSKSGQKQPHEPDVWSFSRYAHQPPVFLFQFQVFQMATRLDDQLLFEKVSPHFPLLQPPPPPPAGGSKTGPGKRRKSSLNGNRLQEIQPLPRFFSFTRRVVENHGNEIVRDTALTICSY